MFRDKCVTMGNTNWQCKKCHEDPRNSKVKGFNSDERGVICRAVVIQGQTAASPAHSRSYLLMVMLANLENTLRTICWRASGDMCRW